MELVNIGTLVPEDHLLRRIDKTIDFTFIYKKVEDLYCKDNGRPPIDPIQLFKMMFLGYLYGIRSERRLEQEVQVNVAYRWFLGLGFRDSVPDHSTISRNRTERFADTGIFQEIFDEIVLQAISKGLIEGKTLYTDSTHLKANANKNRYSKKQVTKSNRRYLDELDAEIEKERISHGKKSLKPSSKDRIPIKETKVSTTDPESGYMVRDRKPKGFFYLDHRTVDGKYNLITDAYVTPGNIHDSIPYLDRLDRQRERFSFDVEAVGLDAGYYNAPICKGLVDREIYGVMPYVRPMGKKGMYHKKDFQFNEEQDYYICPQGKKLVYSTTNRNGYHEYKSNPKVCENCSMLSICTESRNHIKVIARHVWEGFKEEIYSHRLEDKGKRIYERRKETVERSFADAKELHGHRYARYRGKDKVQEQSLMAAICQNIKKMALILDRERRNRSFLPRLNPVFAQINALSYKIRRFTNPPIITTAFA